MQIRQVSRPRRSTGIGHIILYADVDRSEYVSNVTKTGRCAILTNHGEVIRDVLIPKREIDTIEIPDNFDQLGSLVSWNCVEDINQTVITGVYMKRNQLDFFREGERLEVLEGGGQSVTEMRNVTPVAYRGVVVTGDPKASDPEAQGHSIKTSGNGKATDIRQDLDGNINEESDRSHTITTVDEALIQLLDNDEVRAFIKLLKGSDDVISMDADKIEVGQESLEPMLKGDTSVQMMSDIIDQIVVIINGILTANWFIIPLIGPTIPGPVNAAVFSDALAQLQALQAQLDTLKSTKVTVE